MGAFMVWSVAMTPNFPTHMVSMHAALSGLNIGPACSHIVLHTDWLVVALSVLDCAALRNLNLTFSRPSFAI